MIPPVQPAAVKVAVSVPQRTDLLVVITGASGLLPSPITIVEETSEAPHVFTQVAVYDPRPTSIGLPVIPLLQVKVPPVGHDPVRLAFSVPHRVFLLVCTIGFVGTGPRLITTVLEFAEPPHAFTQVAV